MSDIPTPAKVLLKDCEPLEIGDTTEVKETARSKLVYGIAASSTFSKKRSKSKKRIKRN